MLLRLRRENPKLPCAWSDTVSNDAYQELKRWGYWTRAGIYLWSQPQCILGGMVEYGHWIRSAYTSDHTAPDPKIEQTRKVLVFIPEELFKVLFMQYVMDCDKKFKYQRIGLTRPEYYVRLEEATRFYDYYKNIDFS